MTRQGPVARIERRAAPAALLLGRAAAASAALARGASPPRARSARADEPEAPAASRDADGAGRLARARLLGHRVDRATVQRLFSPGHAKQFAAAHPPAWPAAKPANLLTAYRAQAGIGAALTGDPRWDADSEAVLTDVLEDSWRSTAAARLATAPTRAGQFLTTHAPAWPEDKPADLLTAYRQQGGIDAALTGDPDWDQASLAVLSGALEGSWQAAVAARLASARQFVVDNPPAWPANKPDNLLATYRTKRGIVAALSGAPQSASALDQALEESWEAVAAERARVARETARREAVAAARRAVSSTLSNHVLKGDFSGDAPTGYHSTVGGSTTHQAYGSETAIGNGGVYQKSVKGRKRSSDRWVKKHPQSTFFPDTVGGRAATEDDVVVALGTAINSLNRTVKYPEEWAGIQLEKRGDTYFPAGGSDDLAPE